jgi:hypothetical protein
MWEVQKIHANPSNLGSLNLLRNEKLDSSKNHVFILLVYATIFLLQSNIAI